MEPEFDLQLSVNTLLPIKKFTFVKLKKKIEQIISFGYLGSFRFFETFRQIFLPGEG